MSTNNDSPDPSNFFRRWWLWILGIGGTTLGLLAWLAVNYEKVRTNLPLIYADLQYAKQTYWDAQEKQLQTNKDVATAPPTPQPPSSIITQSIPQVTVPACVSHNPGKVLDVLAQAKDAHPRKFEKDYAGRSTCSAGWFATFVEAEKLSNGDTRVTLDSRSGPWLRADVPGGLAAPINKGEIVQVFGTVVDYRQKGFFTYGYIILTKARVTVRR